VHKTLVEQDDKEEHKGGKLEEVMVKEPLIGVTLLALCMQLTQHGVQRGDDRLHKAVDKFLDVALLCIRSCHSPRKERGRNRTRNKRK
jgi:hypothetical protein